MIALTQEKREELIEDCKKEILHAEKLLAKGSLAIGWRKVHEKNLLRNQITLASLTAEPDHHVFKHPLGKLFYSLVDESCKGHDDVYPVYVAPPVPELKLRKLPTLKEVSQIHPGPKEIIMSFKDGAAWMLSEIESLNGLGE